MKTFFSPPVSKFLVHIVYQGGFFGERTNLREYRHVPKYLLIIAIDFFFKRRINSEATK